MVDRKTGLERAQIDDGRKEYIQQQKTVPGHFVREHLIPGHFERGHSIPGHSVQGQLIPGHFVQTHNTGTLCTNIKYTLRQSFPLPAYVYHIYSTGWS